MRLTSSLLLLGAAFGLTFIMIRRREQRAKEEDYVVFYDLDGPRRIPRPKFSAQAPSAPTAGKVAVDDTTRGQRPQVDDLNTLYEMLASRAVPEPELTAPRPVPRSRAASKVAADKVCSDQLAIVDGQLEFEPNRFCPATRGCTASMGAGWLWLECPDCFFDLHFRLEDRTTYIDLPTFLDGMTVDFAMLEKGTGRWLTLRDSAGRLLLAAAQGAVVPPPKRDFFRPLVIERSHHGHIIRHAGRSTFVPTSADCISADSALYYIDTKGTFLAYSTRPSEPK